MTRKEKLLNFMTGGFLQRLHARYDAAFQNMARTYLPAYIQSAKEDINAMSRQEIMRRTRYFEKNSGVMLKILQCLDVNVVGAGINPTPAGSDTAWSKLALAWWDEWCGVSDKTGMVPYATQQSVAYRAENLDGDSFFHLTENSMGRPAVDIFESHQCVSAGVDPKKLEEAGFKVVDGVVIDSQKRPVAYIITDDFDASKITVYPASRIVPVFRHKRTRQYRGITRFHAAVTDLHDLDDLQKYQMRKSKDIASISKFIKTTAGGVTQENAIGASLTPTATTDPIQRQLMYRQTLGGETIFGLPGEELDLVESKSPSAEVTGLWDRIDNKIVQGAGISYAALVDYRGNWGGATLRAVVQSDNRIYELETIDQARASQAVWEYVIGWAIAHGELPPNAEWNKVRWHPPRRATVDIGNDSKAMIEELKAGIRTYEIIYGEAGEDWRERIEQSAKEQAFIDEMATKYKVDRALIASFAQERMTALAPDSAGDPAKGGDKGQNQ